MRETGTTYFVRQEQRIRVLNPTPNDDFRETGTTWKTPGFHRRLCKAVETGTTYPQIDFRGLKRSFVQIRKCRCTFTYVCNCVNIGVFLRTA
jgi:hypothetical protein